MKTKPLLVNLTGPTASGKTAMAIRLAQALKTEILSADSRQIYREMQIGTAVPSAEELHTVPHHFIREIPVSEPFTAADFEREALARLRKLFDKYPVVIMTGGTGLYFHAVNYGLDPVPAVPLRLRRILQQEWNEGKREALLEELRRKDPEYYAEADVQNPRRVLRALEVIRHTGKPFSTFRSGKPHERFFDSVWIQLHWPRTQLYERINRRVDRMMGRGLLDEAKKLYHLRHLPALQTVGYRELFEYFDGNTSLDEAVEAIKKNTRRYAKRQLTWFRKYPQIQHVDMTVPEEEAFARIMRLIPIKA